MFHVLFAVDVTEFYARNEAGMYWCKACGHQSIKLQDVERHIESRHMEWEISCKICHKSLKTPRTLKYHLKNKHLSEGMTMPQLMKWHGFK